LDLPQAALERIAFTVVDVETTGLGRADRVTEVAALRLCGWRETARFQSLCNPGIAIAPAASAVSGITDEMVAQAPIFPEIAPRLEELLEGAVFVAHNAPFDLQFLSRERRRWNLEAWHGPVVDTLRLARNTVALPGYSLASLREPLDLDSAPAHRALADVLATASLLRRLVERMQPPPLVLDDLLRAQEPIPATWAEAIAAGLPTDLAETLQTAEQNEQIAELEYQGRAGSKSFWVRPLAVERNGPLFYLRAELAEGDDKRTFRLDRILRVHLPGGAQPGRRAEGTP
jgi:DNA polymerase-3 subunit epsilon